MKWNMRVLSLVLTALFLPAVDSSLFKNMSSADVQNIGRFVSDLAQGLRINVVALCSGEGEAHYRLMSAFIRNLVFIVSCDAATPPSAHESPRRPPTAHESPRRPPTAHETPRRPPTAHETPRRTPTAPRTGPGVERSFAHTHAELHLTTRALLGSTLARAREKYLASGGQAWQVVLGEKLAPETDAGGGIATWMVANYDKTTQEVALTEVFSFRDSREVVAQNLGRWTPQGRLHLVRPPGAGPRDFRGHVVTLASFPYPPYVMMGKQCPSKVPETFNYDPTCFTKPPAHMVNKEHYVGYLIDIVEAVAATLNFTYRVQPPKDKNQFVFGVGFSDNQSGLVGMVSKGEAEIVLASLSISKERSRAIDFSTHIDYYVRNLYVAMSATTLNVGWSTYVMSFHTSTWVGTAVLVFVATSTLWFIHRAERQTPEDLRSFRDLLFMFFSCLVQQGVPSTPDTYRGRAVFCVFWFACVILYASYTAGLTSALTVSTEGPPFTTLLGAVDIYPSWEIGISKGTAIEEFVKDAQGAEYRTLMSLLSADPGLYVSSEDEGIHRMLTSRYVFFTDSPIMRFMLRDNCSIREIHVNLFKSYGHLGYMKNLPFAWVIDAELALMSDSGVLDRLNKKWWGRGIPCEDPSHFTELGFFQTATAFLILLLGLGLASFFLITEKIIGRRFKSRINRESKCLKFQGGRRTGAESARKHFFVVPDPKYATDYRGHVPTVS